MTSLAGGTPLKPFLVPLISRARETAAPRSVYWRLQNSGRLCAVKARPRPESVFDPPASPPYNMTGGTCGVWRCRGNPRSDIVLVVNDQVDQSTGVASPATDQR